MKKRPALHELILRLLPQQFKKSAIAMHVQKDISATLGLDISHETAQSVPDFCLKKHHSVYDYWVMKWICQYHKQE